MLFHWVMGSTLRARSSNTTKRLSQKKTRQTLPKVRTSRTGQRAKKDTDGEDSEASGESELEYTTPIIRDLGC